MLFEQYSLSAQKKNILFSYKTPFPDDEAIITTDDTKFIEILSNLIDNAIKFTKQGSINFGYQLKENYLECYVEDTGIGILPEMHNEIFKRFRQVETTAARNYGGSGLGLSISQAYVELLGGKIWVKSEPGKGSIFYFTIPYKREISNDITQKQFINKLQIELKKSKQLLVAEDEDSNFMLMEELLSDLNLNIIRAINGVEAVEICKSNPEIDLVLMDLKMPEMDGYEATKQIKKIRPKLPVIAQTAYTTDNDKNKAMECGCVDFITKPINQQILITKIREHLEK